MSSSSSPSVYWEKQEAALCGVHAMNNLLQSPFYTPADLSAIAAELDEKERRLMAESGVTSAAYLSYMARDSQNVDESGNFSLDVLKKSVENFDLQMLSYESSSCADARADPTRETAFIANYKSHWFALRRIAGKWYNLNSFNEAGPVPISDFYLSAYLAQLQSDGYSIFVVRGTFPAVSAESMQGLNGGAGVWMTEEQIKVANANINNSSNGTNSASKGKKSKNKNVTNASPSPSSEEEQLALALQLSMQQHQSSSSSSLSNSTKPKPAATSTRNASNNEDEDEELKHAIALSLQGQK